MEMLKLPLTSFKETVHENDFSSIDSSTAIWPLYATIYNLN